MMKKFYTVLHVATRPQALINAAYAYSNGADGIFLINHSIDTEYLLEIYLAVRAHYPDKWIGLNFLGMDADEAMQFLPSDADGLWTDNAAIDETGTNIAPQKWYEAFKKAHPRCTYFGGVAFKYQRRVDELELAAEKARPCMDVICTSGPATGLAADIEKIQRLYSARGEKTLALASGITPENVSEYLPCADHFLVATGISSSFYMLDPGKVKLLADKIKEYNGTFLTD